jgi:hypothetical protein
MTAPDVDQDGCDPFENVGVCTAYGDDAEVSKAVWD